MVTLRWSRIRRISSPSAWTSSWLRPPAGSSSSRIFGSAASARARSTRFWGPNGGAGMGADPNIVQHRKIGKQRDVLEGAADADFGDPVRLTRQDALAFHETVACARLVEPAQAIEQRRLAGAVRPDQAEDLALMHIEGNAIQCDDAAEHDADVANRKQG